MAMETLASSQSRPAGTKRAIVMILAISAAATLFLFWLIYLHPASDAAGARVAWLPAVNAMLNGASAVSLLVGFTFIRARKIAAHRRSMMTAFVFSSLFLIGYIAHHALHGDIRYPLQAPLRTAYLALLASHILLATVALPMVLVTFFFSLTGRFPQHRRIARWTFPIWLYVSITGVAVYVMLRLALSRE
jgi:putative membrane protein